MTDAELIAIRERWLAVFWAVGVEDVAYDCGWGSVLAASAADVPFLLDALESSDKGRAADCDWILAMVREVAAERDAARAVIEKAHNLYGNMRGTGEQLAGAMWEVLEAGQVAATP